MLARAPPRRTPPPTEHVGCPCGTIPALHGPARFGRVIAPAKSRRQRLRGRRRRRCLAPPDGAALHHRGASPGADGAGDPGARGAPRHHPLHDRLLLGDCCRAPEPRLGGPPLPARPPRPPPPHPPPPPPPPP